MKLLATLVLGSALCLLNAGEKKFTNLEKALENPAEVKHLDLNFESDKGVNKFLKVADQFTNLTNLSLVYHPKKVKEYPALPEAVWNNKKLTRLKVEAFNVNGTIDRIVELTELEELSLVVTQIDHLPKTINQLTKLHFMDLSVNPIKDFPESFGELKNLKRLDLSNCSFSEFPIVLLMIENLEELAIGNREGVGNITMAGGLKLPQNKVRNIPNDIKKWKSLKKLHFSGLGIDELEHDMIRANLPETKIYF